MQDNSRYAVGIDVGTTTIRAVVGHVDATTGVPTIVGVGQAPNNGMRKGVVVNLTGPGHAIDNCLGEAERMSGYEVNAATISVNGSHIISTQVDGMIAVGSLDHEINPDDLMRLEEVATVGKVPANREILEIVPHSYRLDGQDNIKDPIGMTGTRLEINANVVSGLVPHIQNLRKTAEMATVQPNAIVTSVLAAAKAVLTERQIESGVAVIDIGGSTTSVAVFEEGDLQYVGVFGVGGNNITNDLAIGLKIDPEIAEKVKITYGSALVASDDTEVTVTHEKETYNFSQKEIDEIVEARLEDMIERIQKELKKSGREGRLPSGVVFVGGGAKLKHIVDYAKKELGVAARMGKATGYAGVADNIEEPYFAGAVGLMLIDAEGGGMAQTPASHHAKSSVKPGKLANSAKDMISGFLGKFKA